MATENLDSDWFRYDDIRDHLLIQKAGSSLEVLDRALDAVNSGNFEAINIPLLKSLYYLFVYLSRDCLLDRFSSGSSNCVGIRSHQFNYTVKFTDVCDLSNFLFTELSKRFDQLFSDLCIVPVREGFGQSSLHLDTWGPQEDLIVLLRCCMVVLHLVELDLSLLSERCQSLLKILNRLCSSDLHLRISRCMGGTGTSSISFERPVPCKCASVKECSGFTYHNEQSNSPTSFLCSILEVFVDELLLHRKLRRHFMITDSVSCTNEKLFICCSSHDDIDPLFELISAHFVLLISDEQAFKRFLDSLFWWPGKKSPSPELSLTAAMQLLGTPVMLSSPQVFQSYVISLVSKCIGIDMASEDQSVDRRVMNIYISAFERSLILYGNHMSSLQLGDHPVTAIGERPCGDKPCTSAREFCPSFEYYIRPGTYETLNLKLSNDGDFAHNSLSKSKSDLLSACIAYMTESGHILVESHRDEILSVLNGLISWILSGKLNATIMLKSEDLSQQEMYLLASLIKLMSSSMLQIIWLMQGRRMGRIKTLKDYSCCKEYNFIIDIISRFGQHIFSLPSNLLGASPASCKGSKLMLMHFVGLLLFSFDRHEVLWKGCIFMMMTLMNLIIFEDGNLEALKPLPGLKEESLPSQSLAKSPEVLVKRSSPLVIASKFPKVQVLNHLSYSPNAWLEGGNLEALKPLPGLKGEPLASQSLVKSPEVAVKRNSTLVIASKFRKIQVLNHLRRDTHSKDDIEATCGQSESSEISLLPKGKEEVDDICNGEEFLKLVIKGKRKPYDYDDLANFIACKRGKDYSSWLKNTEKFRKWKNEKKELIRWEKKRAAWKLPKGNVIQKLIYL